MADPVVEQLIDTVGDQEVGRSVPRALAPFQTSAYRRLAIALVCTTFANGVWLVGQVWEVIRLGGGPTQLSFVATAASVGTLLPALLGGVVADRIPQKRILLAVAVVEVAVMSTVMGLSLAGLTQLWHLALAAFVAGVALAFYYPAYSAWLPALVPEQDLMAVNGFEGMVRPVLGQAAGPAVAGAVVGLASPGAAFAIAAGVGTLAVVALTFVPLTPVRRTGESVAPSGSNPVASALADIAEGFGYMWRTPWLLATLVFASLMVLVVVGPLEVLIPFQIKDGLGGDSNQHAWVLAGFGVGGAVGSFVMGSCAMPRRYLTTMILLWGVGCLPMIAIGTTSSIAVMIAAAALLGLLFSAPMVIWGTLLQRRVPPHMLGRVASLDFFVSISLMPVSMALAGPVAELIGLANTFLVAGLAPAVLAVVAIVWARLPEDEIAHPLT